MGFRLIPNSVTLDDLERRNNHTRIVISPNSVAFVADYVKVVEDTPVLAAAEMYAQESSFSRYTPCSEKSGIFCFQRNFTSTGSIFLQFSVTITK